MPRHSIPPEWADFGARWGDDGLLYLAEWRRGFSVHEIRALFFECQQVRSLTHELRRAESELETLREAQSALQQRIDWYRHQLRLGNALGPILQSLSAINHKH